MSLFDYFRKRQEFSVGAPVMTEEIVENGNRETDEKTHPHKGACT